MVAIIVSLQICAAPETFRVMTLSGNGGLLVEQSAKNNR
jgi:hypothetical protein